MRERCGDPLGALSPEKGINCGLDAEGLWLSYVNMVEK